MLLKKIILGFALIIPYVLFGQTGPAGVGSSSSNILWVRSEDLSALSNGDRITTWADYSGNSNDLTQSNSSFQPEYVTNQQNGYPVVRFNQSNNRLIKNTFNDFPSSGITVFIVDKSNGENEDGIFSYAVTGSNNEFLLFDTDALRLYRGSNVTSTLDYTNNAWHIIDASWTSSGGNVRICKDNNFASSYTSTIANGSNITTGGCLAIAAEQDAVDGSYDASQTHNSDMLEIIVYNNVLNIAQRIIVGNYIAAKYDLTISNDYYAYQSIYSHELAGIGRYDASNTHTAAQSAKMITIGNASDMTSDGEYLLYAHNNGSIASWSATGSGYNTQKIAREWRLDETGDVGAVDITLNENDLPALPSGYTKYGVMIDADGDYTSGALVYEMAASGSDYKATGVSVADGDYMTIVAIKPSVQFITSSGSADESVNASVDVELNYVPTSAVSVEYSTSNGTATGGSDYTSVAATTLNFAAGERTKSVSITVIDDATSESNEDFTINLANPSSGLNIGANATYTHNIDDNDNSRKIYFTAASSSGSESTTNVSITVEISSADGSNPTSADYTVIGGTATGSGTDYTLADGTATISSGNTTTTISFTINNDALDEDNETIIIKLSNANNANLSTTNPTEYTYTINDDDATPTIQFTTTSSSGSESTTNVNLQLTLSAASSKDVDVSFSASGTATNGSDYSISSSPTTITAGNTTTNISLTVNNNAIPEADKTVIVTISAPVNASLGTNTTHTYTILNDDTYGYDGPGGVGKATNLKIWVKAEDIPGSSDGDRIGSWQDRSGNSNDLTQSDGTYKPYYFDNIVNGFQVMRCYTDDRVRLVKTSFSDFPTSEITEYIVRQTSNDFYGELSYATSGNYNEFLFFNYNDNLRVFRGNSNRATSVNPPNTWAIAATSWRNSDDQLKVVINGDEKYNGTLSSTNDITQGGCLSVGAEQDGLNSNYHTNDDFEGDIAEVLIFNVLLSTAQRNIVNNYLSAKYNISMSVNDKYAGDIPANGDYDFEVIGIGTESDGVHNEAHGSGGLWIKQNSNFGNGDYLMIGHNHITPQLYTPTEDAGLSAASIQQRWARDWYFDLTDAGSTESVDLTFDFTEAEMNSSSSPAGTVSNYKLLYRSGTTGNWTIVTSASSIGSSQVVFSAVSLTNGDGYYALGTTDATSSPLPIELLSFNANLLDNKVELIWLTASEKNNDFFSIERSIDANQWEVLTTVKGQGNSNEVQKYSVMDLNPLNGTSYYRLKQTDFDGQFTYSSIRAIHNASVRIQVYPNPVTKQLIVESSERIVEISAFDMLGKEYQLNIDNSNQNFKIDVSKLSNGIYYLRLRTNTETKNIKIIKQ